MKKIYNIIDRTNKLSDRILVEELSKLEYSSEELDTERLALDFVLLSGQVCSKFVGVILESGGPLRDYPSYEWDFKEKQVEYLKKRKDEVTNPYLLLRYNQIIYRSPYEKNNRYGIDAIDFSKVTIEKELSLDTENYELLFSIENYIGLAVDIKSKHDECKEFVDDILINHGLSPVKILSLFNIIFKYKKVFGHEYLKKLEGVAKNAYSINSKEETNLHAVIDSNEVLIKLSRRIGEDIRPWIKEKAILYEKLCVENELNPMRSIIFCGDSIKYYKEAGSREDFERMIIKHQKLKSKFELPIVKLKIDVPVEVVDDFMEKSNSWIEETLNLSSRDMYKVLSCTNQIFPTREILEKVIKEKPNTTSDLFGKVIFDKNSNVITTSDGGKDSIKHNHNLKFHEQYAQSINMVYLDILCRIIQKGIRKEKITFESLLIFLSEDSWIGRYPMFGGDILGKGPSWIDIITPSIQEYFRQVEGMFSTDSFKPTFVLVLDSLVTKFEGVFRDLAEIKGCNVTATTNDGQRQRFLHELLRDSSIVEKFHNDDILLFIHIYLTEGRNIRNDIGHSFFTPDNYNFETATLVLFSFIRLGRYDISRTL